MGKPKPSTKNDEPQSEVVDAKAIARREAQSADAAMLATVQQSSRALAFAQAESARARVEARYVLALKRPRTIELVRTNLLGTCKRPAFAKAALYKKPIGQTNITGLSIRFVEEALREFGNVDIEVFVMHDDEKTRTVGVSVLDLERNVGYSAQATLRKTIERRFLKKNQVKISERTNSKGDRLFVVEATEDDMLVKAGAQVSKLIRTQGVRLMPADLKEDCEEQIRSTIADRDAADPQAATKEVIDGLMRLQVNPKMVEAFLEHKIAEASPAEIRTLRELYTAIKEGEATWPTIMQAKKEQDAAAEAERKAAEKNKTDKGSTDDLKPGAEKGAQAEKPGAKKKAAAKKSTKPKPGATGKLRQESLLP